MDEILLYHGSQTIVKEPIFGFGKKTNDYGHGFYCTEDIELAKEWACLENADGFANCYSLNMQGLNVLDLSSEEYSVLNWLAILLDNRICRFSSPVEKKGRDYIICNFLPEYKDYDVIRGYRADDSYFAFARAFVSNTISVGQLQYALKLGKLGEQVVLKSKNAFDAIEFKEYVLANNEIYFPKRKTRNDIARNAFYKELENDDSEGLFIREIISKEITNNDSRIR